MRSYLASFSIYINEVTGGERTQTLCARISLSFGPRCVFCRVVGAVLREPEHCQTEADTYRKSCSDS